MSDEVRIVLDDQAAASRIYRDGLQQGVVTTRIEPPPAQGQSYTVVIEAPFADSEFTLQGVVVHSGDHATAIWMSAIPGDLRRVCIGAESTLPVDSMFTLDEPTGESADAEEIRPETSTPAPTPAVEPVADAEKHDDAEWPSLEHPPQDQPVEDEPPSPEAKQVVEDVPPPKPSPDAEAAGGKRKNYLSERLARDAKARRTSKKRTPWDRSPRAPGKSAPKAAPEASSRRKRRSPQPFLEDSGIPIPARPELQIPGIVKFEEALERVSPYEIFLRIAAERLTGVGVFDVDEGRYWAYLIRGGPVQYIREPEFQRESLDELIIRRNLVTGAVLEQAQRLAAITSRPLVSLVMRLDLINESQLHSLRSEQTRLVSERLLECDSGRFRFYEIAEIREVFRESGSEVVKALWRHAASRFEAMSAAELTMLHQRMMPQFTSVTAEGKRLIHRLPLSPPQKQFVNRLLRPSRPVAKLFVRLQIPRDDAVRLLLALQKMGVVALSSQGAENEQDAELERKLRERMRRMERDHFGFLGLHWSALPDELIGACEAVEQELAEIDAIGASLTNYSTMHDAIMSRLAEIRKLAGSDRARKRYRADIIGEPERFMAAETLLKQAEMALFRNENAEAKEAFQRLLEIDPGGAGSHERLERAKLALFQIEDAEPGR